MYRYKNLSDQDLTVVGLGFIKANGEVESANFVENPNLELIGSDEKPANPPAQPEGNNNAETEEVK